MKFGHSDDGKLASQRLLVVPLLPPLVLIYCSPVHCLNIGSVGGCSLELIKFFSVRMRRHVLIGLLTESLLRDFLINVFLGDILTLHPFCWSSYAFLMLWGGA